MRHTSPHEIERAPAYVLLSWGHRRACSRIYKIKIWWCWWVYRRDGYWYTIVERTTLSQAQGNISTMMTRHTFDFAWAFLPRSTTTTLLEYATTYSHALACSRISPVGVGYQNKIEPPCPCRVLHSRPSRSRLQEPKNLVAGRS